VPLREDLPSACGQIGKTFKIAPHGFANYLRADGLTVVNTDILIDALRGFGPGLNYIEDAEQRSTLHIRITTEGVRSY
jgi:hypothetical protein